jgi:hypothetical protein
MAARKLRKIQFSDSSHSEEAMAFRFRTEVDTVARGFFCQRSWPRLHHPPGKRRRITPHLAATPNTASSPREA